MRVRAFFSCSSAEVKVATMPLTWRRERKARTTESASRMPTKAQRVAWIEASAAAVRWWCSAALDREQVVHRGADRVHPALALEHAVEGPRLVEPLALYGAGRLAHPRIVAMANLGDAALLLRVVGHEGLELLEHLERRGLLVRFEEDATPGDQHAAQARLLVDDLLLQLVGLGDDLVGVVEPVRVVGHARHLRPEQRACAEKEQDGHDQGDEEPPPEGRFVDHADWGLGQVRLTLAPPRPVLVPIPPGGATSDRREREMSRKG